MLYDLICAECGNVYKIMCSMAKKPDWHNDLIVGIKSGDIHFQDEDDKGPQLEECCGPLSTDFTEYAGRQPQRINWPKIENLK